MKYFWNPSTIQESAGLNMLLLRATLENVQTLAKMFDNLSKLKQKCLTTL